MTEPYIYTYKRRIYFGDTDAWGVAYYANYLQYFEEARAEYIQSVGFTLNDLVEKNCVFVVREAYIDYKSPAKLGDEILVDTWISERTRVMLMFHYRIRRAAINGTSESQDDVIVEGWTKLAACQVKRDREVVVTRMPSWVTGPLDKVGVPRI